MATIYSRKNKDSSYTWRVMIRRKYIPILCLSFESKDEAIKWVEENENKYVLEYEKYHEWINQERLRLEREREFRKRKMK